MLTTSYNSFARRLQQLVSALVSGFNFTANGSEGRTNPDGEMPEESILAQLSIDNVKVEKLVREFLTAQSLIILPQNSFGDAVSQFVDKDDKHAMEMFVNESLAHQIKHLLEIDQQEDEGLQAAIDEYRSKLEQLFAAGRLKKVGLYVELENHEGVG